MVDLKERLEARYFPHKFTVDVGEIVVQVQIEDYWFCPLFLVEIGEDAIVEIVHPLVEKYEESGNC